MFPIPNPAFGLIPLGPKLSLGPEPAFAFAVLLNNNFFQEFIQTDIKKIRD